MKTIVIFNAENYNTLEEAQKDHADYPFQVPMDTPDETIRIILTATSEMVFNSTNNIKAVIINNLI